MKVKTSEARRVIASDNHEKRQQQLLNPERSFNWQDLHKAIEVVYTGNDSEEGIEELMNKPIEEYTARDCRTFQTFLMTVLIYRTGQRPEWVNNFTLKDWSLAYKTLASGSIVLNLEHHKTRHFKKIASAFVDSVYTPYFRHFFENVRPRYLAILNVAKEGENGCEGCKVVTTSNVSMGNQQAQETFYAFTSQSCGKFYHCPLYGRLNKNYGFRHITSTEARHNFETASRCPELQMSDLEIETLTNSLSHSKETAEKNYVDYVRNFAEYDRIKTEVKNKMDAKFLEKDKNFPPGISMSSERTSSSHALKQMTGPGLFAGSSEKFETPRRSPRRKSRIVETPEISSTEGSPCKLRLRLTRIDSETPDRVLRAKRTLSFTTTPRKSPRLSEDRSKTFENETTPYQICRTKRALELVGWETSSKKMSKVLENVTEDVDVTDVRISEEEIVSHVTSCSGATELSLKQTTDYWCQHDLQSLVNFESGSVVSFVKVPEAQLAKNILHVWQVYCNCDRALALIEHFKNVCDAETVLQRKEWPKFREFLLPNEEESLNEKGEKVTTNCLRGRLFERYKDNEIEKYIYLKADELSEAQFEKARTKENAQTIFEKLLAGKIKSKKCETIMQRKKVLNRLQIKINKHVFERDVVPALERKPLFKIPHHSAS